MYKIAAENKSPSTLFLVADDIQRVREQVIKTLREVEMGLNAPLKDPYLGKVFFPFSFTYHETDNVTATRAAILQQPAPDAIILDLCFDEKTDGYTFLEEARKGGYSGPVAILTSMPDGEIHGKRFAEYADERTVLLPKDCVAAAGYRIKLKNALSGHKPVSVATDPFDRYMAELDALEQTVAGISEQPAGSVSNIAGVFSWARKVAGAYRRR